MASLIENRVLFERSEVAMVFSFKDGSQLEVEPSKSHNFIQHDLAWVIVARGGLTHISYQTGERTNVVRHEDGSPTTLPSQRLESCETCRF